MAKQSYSSAQHYSSLAKARTFPKTVHASKLNLFSIKRVSATKMAKILLNCFGLFLETTGRSQHSWCFCQNNVDGSAQHHGSPAKAHTSPKTVHSCGKTKFLSHLNCQCPQNA